VSVAVTPFDLCNKVVYAPDTEVIAAD